MTIKLNVVIGSTRPSRVAPIFANWIAARAEAHEAFDVELIDLADFNLPLLDEASHPRLQDYRNESTRRWSASVAAADAYVFVTPEYDYFPPAALINAIQVLFKEWAYKPAGIMSFGGISAGLRATQALRQLLGNLNVHALPQSVPVPMFSQFIADGVLTPNPQMEEGADLMLGELARWARALKPLRAG